MLLVWTFLNAYILVSNSKYEMVVSGFKFIYHDHKRYVPIEGFYPFSDPIYYYDTTEFYVYVGGAWLVYLLYRILKN